MKHSTGKPTKAQQARFQALKELGCICCWNYCGFRMRTEIHHIVDKGYRKHSGGHDATIPLCVWHHRGVYDAGIREPDITAALGPSLALDKREFIRVFGTERQLLETVNAMLERAA
jgi:hypothetical protein